MSDARDTDAFRNDADTISLNRLLRLFDPKTFVEIGKWWDESEDGSRLSEGVVTGYGKINGETVFAYAQDNSVLGGSFGKAHAEKITNLQKKACTMGAPIIGLLDSSGARLSEGLSVLNGYGEVLSNASNMKGMVPQIVAVFGECTGATSVIAGMSDFTFMLRDQSVCFLSGPNFIRESAGDVTEKQLFNGDFHTSVSGMANFISEGEDDLFEKMRDLLAYLPKNNLEIRKVEVLSSSEYIAPEIMSGEISDEQMEELIRSVSDNGNFLEIGENFAPEMLTAFLFIGGQTVGVIANRRGDGFGNQNIATMKKASSFIRYCDTFNIPLLSFVNTENFEAGKKLESEGVERFLALQLSDYVQATISKISILVGRAYGMAGLVMGSKSTGSDFVIALPSAEVSLINPVGMADILYAEDISEAEDPKRRREELGEYYRLQYAEAAAAARSGYVDAVLTSQELRNELANLLDVLTSKRDIRYQKKHRYV